ncbi:MAG: hypothetical protein HQ521_01085, partial [Bacteroidetes bacterium]|nr:hypothetical protein [Bacteroidota bacterium]
YKTPQIYLGFKSDKYHIYDRELDKIKNKSPQIRISYEVSNGTLNIRQILKENDPGATYFISGPPTMLLSFKNFLLSNGVVENNILTDDWG